MSTHPLITTSTRPTEARPTEATTHLARRGLRHLDQRLIKVEGHAHRWLVAHSIAVLRVSLGLVFLGFGVLKYVPGLSPAADLAITTTHLLTFGVVGDVIPSAFGLLMVATLECTIGVLLITAKLKRLTVYLLIVQLVGIMSPVFLLTDRLFAGPHHAPTLEGQYVLKDIVLVAATMVIATAFRGAKINYPTTTRHSLMR